MEKKVILVVASDGFQQDEYHETYKVLIESGIQVITASDRQGQAIAHDGSTVSVDCTIQDIISVLYDGIFLIGGRGALVCLDTPFVHKFLNEFFALQKAYGAICISPRILAKAGVLRSKQATCWDGDHKAEIVFKENNVTFINKSVVVDGKVVTANGPAAAVEFGKMLIKVL